MTLVVATQVDLQRGPTLLVATDSVLSAGYRWPRGSKLFSLGAACVMAFEGDTEIAYPLALNATNFVALSDNLSGGDAEPAAVFGRVRLGVSEAYEHLAQDPYFTPGSSSCSFVLAGWSWRLSCPVVWVLEPPPVGAPAGTQWSARDVVSQTDWTNDRSYFTGNGDIDPVAAAWSDLRGNPAPKLPAYAAFLARVHDSSETSVGGTPQIALLGPRYRQFIGIRDPQGRRHLLGHRVLSGAEGITYHDEQLSSLQ